MRELYSTTDVRLTLPARATVVPIPGPTVRSKPRKGHAVSLGPWESTATTEQAAREELAGMVATAAGRLDKDGRPVVLMFGGYVSVIVADVRSADGWTVDTYGPDGRRGGTTLTSGTAADVEAATRYALATRTVDPFCDESVQTAAGFLAPDKPLTEYLSHGPRELYRWVGWQRAYRAAEQSGKPSDECHEWASRHAAEHIPECGRAVALV